MVITPYLIWSWKQSRVRPANYLDRRDGRKVVPFLAEYEVTESRETMIQPSWDRPEPVKFQPSQDEPALEGLLWSLQREPENNVRKSAILHKLASESLFISPLEKKIT